MSKHTPGPWAEARTRQLGGPFDDNDLNTTHFWHVRVIQGGNGDHVADVNLFHDANDYTESYANARLIAAAPDLLAALKAIMETDAVRDDDDNPGEGTPYDDARAAIAKAEGGEA